MARFGHIFIISKKNGGRSLKQHFEKISTPFHILLRKKNDIKQAFKCSQEVKILIIL